MEQDQLRQTCSACSTSQSPRLRPHGGWVAGKRQKEEMIGNVKLKVEHVVRNQRIRDQWALQEVQRGDIDLILEWTPVVLDD